jgi:hypothetical protein
MARKTHSTRAVRVKPSRAAMTVITVVTPT